MSEKSAVLEMIYRNMYIAVLVILAVMLFVCLIRAVRGPRVADRIVAVNMMGTMVMVMIAVLSLLLKEGFLVGICLIYAMVSFLAVVVISMVYMGVYAERAQRRRQKYPQGHNREADRAGMQGTEPEKGESANGNS